MWNELADWFVEAAKARLQRPDAQRDVARAVLVHVFDHALRLLHPVMPFITEALWQRLPSHVAGTFVATASWPTASPAAQGWEHFDVVREAIGAIRQLRSDYQVPPGHPLRAHVLGASTVLEASLGGEAEFVARRTHTALDFSAAPTGAAAHAVLSHGLALVLPLAGAIDLDKECARLRSEQADLAKQLTALRGRLANEKFVARAPADVVDGERTREREWSARHEQLGAKVRALCGG